MTDLLNVKEKIESKPTIEETKNDPRPLMKRKVHPWRKVIIVLVIGILGIAGSLAYKLYYVGSRVLQPNEEISFFGQLKTLFKNPEKPLKGEEEGRINVLLLGLGGEGHQGAYLTDTIIVASFNPVSKEVAMLSLPRDLFVEIPGYGYRKINNAFAFGRNEDKKDGGENLAQATVQQTLDIPIHYYAWIDFKGFEKIIDDVGGVEIDVERSFVDYSYPTSNYGYQTIRYDKGTSEMDGDTALKFVRSRKGTNGEGSDFARSARQQKVLLAVKEKLLAFGTLANPTKVNAVLDDLANHMETNFQIWELLKLSKMFGVATSDHITSRVLDNSPSGLLVNDTTIDGAYILRPRDGDFTDVRYLADNIFELNAIERENASIAVFNGSAKEGLAKEVAEQLGALSYDVVRVDSTATQVATVVYDLSAGEKTTTVNSLKERFGATVQTTLPQSLQKEFAADDQPDILLLLGTDVLPKEIQGGSVT